VRSPALRFARSVPSAGAGSEQPSTWARLRLLIGDQGKLIVATGFLVILSALAEAVTLALIAQIAATLVKVNGTHVRVSVLHIHAPTKTLILAAFVISVARLVLLQVPQTLLPARVMASVWARLRMNLFESFSNASWEVQSREREGKLQEIMTNQAGQATQGLGSLLSLINSTLTFIVLLAFAFVLNLFAAVIVLALAVSMLAILRPLRGLGRRRARALSRAQVNYAAGIAESIRIAEETHVFGVAAALRRQIDKRVAASRRLLFQTQLLSRIGSNVSETFVYLLLVCGLFLLYTTGDKHVASLGAVVLILVRASSSGQSIQGAYQSLIQAMPFIELTQETEQRYRESRPHVGTQPLTRVASVAFDGVGYEYRPGRPVLSDIRFEVDEGEVVGIIGPSGAGKSTLVQLLLRLRTPSQGRYLVNGIPAQEIIAADWRQRVTYVPQEPRLLHASVAENIRFFRDLDDEAVQRAGRLARIHDDIMGWADGYETIVGPRADAVSGGQQQRICLARALVARPEMLVLDEPTSALDPTSESLIQESLMGLKQQLTLFIVAHRMSTLDICDRVMIIIDGKLTAFDTIELLRRENPYYRSASALAARGTLL
jgi:ABC-type multidrug transport system fused ATPase/permease subunit